jgi:4-diphosphocytidyl-2-C-methyl-D-erythritol kinase
MIIQKTVNGYRATVPCKVNLFLEVLGKREDGYHSLDTIMMAVSLVDDLEISPRTDRHLNLSVEFPDGFGKPIDDQDFAWDLPTDASNLVVRALSRLREVLDLPNVGADVKLVKRIPSKAGLGGGSADAAAALVLGWLLWGMDSDYEKLAAIASELGSDLNLFLEGHSNGFWLARCQGRGERIEPQSCGKPLHFVIVHPPRGCCTRGVFASLANAERDYERLSPESLLNVLKVGAVDQLGTVMFNRLESAAMRTTDWIARSRRWIDHYNHRGQCMSGSGSARFCLCTSREEAEKIVSELRENGGMRAYCAESWQSSGIEEQVRRIRKEQ